MLINNNNNNNHKRKRKSKKSHSSSYSSSSSSSKSSNEFSIKSQKKNEIRKRIFEDFESEVILKNNEIDVSPLNPENFIDSFDYSLDSECTINYIKPKIDKNLHDITLLSSNKNIEDTIEVCQRVNDVMKNKNNINFASIVYSYTGNVITEGNFEKYGLEKVMKNMSLDPNRFTYTDALILTGIDFNIIKKIFSTSINENQNFIKSINKVCGITVEMLFELGADFDSLIKVGLNMKTITQIEPNVLIDNGIDALSIKKKLCSDSWKTFFKIGFESDSLEKLGFDLDKYITTKEIYRPSDFTYMSKAYNVLEISNNLNLTKSSLLKICKDLKKKNKYNKITADKFLEEVLQWDKKKREFFKNNINN